MYFNKFYKVTIILLILRLSASNPNNTTIVSKNLNLQSLNTQLILSSCVSYLNIEASESHQGRFDDVSTQLIVSNQLIRPWMISSPANSSNRTELKHNTVAHFHGTCDNHFILLDSLIRRQWFYLGERIESIGHAYLESTTVILLSPNAFPMELPPGLESFNAHFIGIVFGNMQDPQRFLALQESTIGVLESFTICALCAPHNRQIHVSNNSANPTALDHLHAKVISVWDYLFRSSSMQHCYDRLIAPSSSALEPGNPMECLAHHRAIEALARKYNFTPKYYPSPEFETVDRKPSLIINDVVYHDLELWESRRVITIRIEATKFVYCARHTKFAGNSFHVWLEPFRLLVWYFVAVTFLLITFILYYTNSNKFNFFDCLFTTISVLLNQSFEMVSSEGRGAGSKMYSSPSNSTVNVVVRCSSNSGVVEVNTCSKLANRPDSVYNFCGTPGTVEDIGKVDYNESIDSIISSILHDSGNSSEDEADECTESNSTGRGTCCSSASGTGNASIDGAISNNFSANGTSPKKGKVDGDMFRIAHLSGPYLRHTGNGGIQLVALFAALIILIFYSTFMTSAVIAPLDTLVIQNLKELIVENGYKIHYHFPESANWTPPYEWYADAFKFYNILDVINSSFHMNNSDTLPTELDLLSLVVNTSSIPLAIDKKSFEVPYFLSRLRSVFPTSNCYGIVEEIDRNFMFWSFDGRFASRFAYTILRYHEHGFQSLWEGLESHNLKIEGSKGNSIFETKSERMDAVKPLSLELKFGSLFIMSLYLKILCLGVFMIELMIKYFT